MKNEKNFVENVSNAKLSDILSIIRKKHLRGWWMLSWMLDAGWKEKVETYR